MSPSLSDIFAADARKYLDTLRSGLEAEGGPYPDVIRRAARRLHHSAALASHEPVMYVSAALQKTSVQLIAGKRQWSEGLNSSMEAVLQTLEEVLTILPSRDPTAEARLRSAADRLVSSATEQVAPAKEEPVSEDESEAVLAALINDLSEAVERLESDAPALPSGELVASAPGPGELWRLDPRASVPPVKLPIQLPGVTGIAVLPGGDLLAAQMHENRIVRVDLSDRR